MITGVRSVAGGVLRCVWRRYEQEKSPHSAKRGEGVIVFEIVGSDHRGVSLKL